MKAFTVGPVTYSQEWYDLRSLDPSRNPAFVLGASDAGVLCGVSKWKTALELFYEICGYRERIEETEAMRMGKRLEAAILEEYTYRHDIQITRPTNMYLSIEHPFLGASLDAEGVDDDGPFCVEAKSTTSRMYDPVACKERDCFGDGPDDVPNDYLMQAQQQMLVTGYDRCDIAVLFDGSKLRVYPQTRNQRIMDAIVKRGQQFCKQVLSGEAPPPDWGHPTTLDLLKDTAGFAENTRAELVGNDAEWFEKWLESRAEIKRLEAVEKECMSHIVAAIGCCEVGYVAGSPTEIRRVRVDDSFWTDEDILKAQEMKGQVKRKGHVRYMERNAK